MSKTLLAKLSIITGLVLYSFGLMPSGAAQVSAACATLPDDNGRAESTITVETSGDYTVWVRMKTDDSANKEIRFSLGDQCDVRMGGSAVAADGSWYWTKTDTSNNDVTVSLTAGQETLQLAGSANSIGVGVDRALLLTDASCTPTGTGDNCTPDITPPTVNVTSPSDGALVNGTTTLTANATDSSGVDSVQFKVDGNDVGLPVTSSPYEFSWDSNTVSEGNHTITAVATDSAGNEATSPGVVVDVVNTVVPPSQDDMQAWWKFNDGSGTTASDSTGNGNTGTLVGSPAWTTGHTGEALDFNGSSSRVELGTLNVNASGFTFAGWINAESLPQDPRIFSKANGSADSAHFVMLSVVNSGSQPDLLRFRLKAGGTTTTLIADNGSISTGQWHHVAARYDGSTMKLYLDGSEVGSVAKTGSVDADNSVNTWIGANPTGSNFFDGKIDDVQLYSSALSPLEILALASGEEPTSDGGSEDTTPPSNPSGLSSPNITDTSVQLSWNASSDNVGVTGYEISRATLESISTGDSDETLITAVTGTDYTDSELLPDTGYRYFVRAVDAAGNRSGSATVDATTDTSEPDPDPSVPGDFNDDDQVNLLDFSLFTGRFGTSSTGSSDPYDMNRDGQVNLLDFSLFVVEFKK